MSTSFTFTRFAVAFLLSACLAVASATDAMEKSIDSLIAQMTLEEKISLMGGGRRNMEIRGLERLGIPRILCTDGPVGVRRSRPTTAMPASVTLASTWDTTLAYRYGQALALETRAHGRDCLLAPCVNIHRLPVGGRNFESYGEDPFLAARLGVAYIRGVQDQGVLASVKHYALNNQEWSRNNVTVLADERTMREIYLPAFEAAVKEADVWTVMSAYNRLNGHYCTANTHLLTDILKDEWGFRGVVISDWSAVHHAVKAVNAGQDLEMPSDNYFNADSLVPAVKDGRVKEKTIDGAVRRLLRVRFLAGMFDPKPRVRLSADSLMEKHKSLALEVARQGVVLLKNRGKVLPLSTRSIRSLTVIGPNAADTRVGGGGSSRTDPAYSVSPFQGIKNRLGDNVKVEFAQGCRLPGRTRTRIAGRFFRASSDSKESGLKAEFFNNVDFTGKPVATRIDSMVNFEWGAQSPHPSVRPDSFAVRWTGVLVADSSRLYHFNALTDDGVRVYIEDSLVITGWRRQGPTNYGGRYYLEKGKPYRLRLEYCDVFSGATIRLSWDWPPPAPDTSAINAAARLAAASDAAVVFAGSADFLEAEGRDRPGLELDGFQDELIAAVARANPRTIVVLTGGTPAIISEWIDSVPALVQASFLGQETGNALAAILLGDVNPSGKLPYSYITSYDQSPAFEHYLNHDLKAPYDEGIYVGYRYLDKNNLTPSFPFGHGLSYTTFTYSKMKIKQRGPHRFDVSASVKNTGAAAGCEIVQVYVADKQSSMHRPLKELKGFARVSLEPGKRATFTVPLDKRSFAYYDTKRKDWVVEPGTFDILVGASAGDIRLRKQVNIK